MAVSHQRDGETDSQLATLMFRMLSLKLKDQRKRMVRKHL